MLDGLHELRGVDEAVVGAGVEPGIAAAEALHLQLPGLEVAAVEIGNLQLAARRGLQVGSDIADLLVIEVEPGDGKARLRPARLLLPADRTAGGVALDDAVAPRVGHLVAEPPGERKSGGAGKRGYV